MRSLVLALSFCCAAFAAGADQIGDADTARPGGVYTSLSAATPAACATLCAEDGICLAWTYQASGQCELKAVAPPAVAMPGAWSGLSSRAPEFARRIAGLPAGTPAEAPAHSQSAVQIAQADTAATHHADTDLLGGPEPAPGDLRTRFADH